MNSLRVAIPTSSTSDSCFRQCLLQPIETLARRLLRRSAAFPMRLKAQPVAEPITLQCLQLSDPIHNAVAHRCPVVFAIWLEDPVLAVAVPNSLSRKQLVSVRIRRAPNRRRIA